MTGEEASRACVQRETGDQISRSDESNEAGWRLRDDHADPAPLNISKITEDNKIKNKGSVIGLDHEVSQ
jgi:hypothetical protein